MEPSKINFEKVAYQVKVQEGIAIYNNEDEKF